MPCATKKNHFGSKQTSKLDAGRRFLSVMCVVSKYVARGEIDSDTKRIKASLFEVFSQRTKKKADIAGFNYSRPLRHF